MLNILRTIKYTLFYDLYTISCTVRGVPLFWSLDAITFGEDCQKQHNARKNHAFCCYGIALVKGKIKEETPTLVRVHSQCLTGDVFGSFRCDCGEQLKKSMEMIAENGTGVLLYLYQEGRGIGIINKLKTYALQDEGQDTVEANASLGFKPDLREYGIGAQILKNIGLGRIRLMTNNPRKIVGLEGYGLQMVERVPIEVNPKKDNIKYLRTKKKKLGHVIKNIS